jgi:regulator of RNase E activity RraA
MCRYTRERTGGGLGSTNAPILIGQVAIQPGDAVIGDADGVVIPAARVAKVVAAAQAREAMERDVLLRPRASIPARMGLFCAESEAQDPPIQRTSLQE